MGVGSLTGSRAATLTAVIGWQAIATNILLNISFLGHARDALLTAALTQIMPVSGGDRQTVTMAAGVAVIVMIGWVVIASAAGAWRTQTVDA